MVTIKSIKKRRMLTRARCSKHRQRPFSLRQEQSQEEERACVRNRRAPGHHSRQPYGQ